LNARYLWVGLLPERRDDLSLAHAMVLILKNKFLNSNLRLGLLIVEGENSWVKIGDSACFPVRVYARGPGVIGIVEGGRGVSKEAHNLLSSGRRLRGRLELLGAGGLAERICYEPRVGLLRLEPVVGLLRLEPRVSSGGGRLRL
jgi:hypothetical protein